MNLRTYLASAILACGGLSAAQGAIIFSDNFDGYADTTAFTTAWPVVSPQPTGTIVTDRFVSSPNSVHNVGTTVTASAERNGKSFAESGTVSTIGDKLIWSFDFYDSNIGGNPQRNYANLQDGTAPGATTAAQLISLGLNNNQLAVDSGGNYYMARILGFAHSAVDPDGGPSELAAGTTSGAYFKLNDFGTGLRAVGWHNLKVVLSTNDGLSVDMDFFVDNTLAEKVYDIGDAGAFRSYDVIRIGSGVSNGGIDANFDNMQLELIPVPEPSSLALAGLLSMGLLCVRRRACITQS